LYIFNLGMSYDIYYKGTVYGKYKKDFLEKLFEPGTTMDPGTQFA